VAGFSREKAGAYAGVPGCWRAVHTAEARRGGGAFLFGLFIALGFLLCGRRRFPATPLACRADTELSV